MNRAAALFLVLVCAPSVAAADPPATGNGALRVLIDCRHYLCDREFFVTEINFVDHVRDRQDAQVHILIATEQTGAGGTRWEVEFIGQSGRADLSHRLDYVSAPSAPEDEIRKGLTRTMTLGLMPYLAGTDTGVKMEIRYDAPESETVAEPVVDPWKAWVFRTSVSGNGSAESLFSSYSLNASASASRVTDTWKTSFSLRGSYSESLFDLGINPLTNVREEVFTFTNSYNASASQIRSLGPHWSVRARGFASSATFRNKRFEWGGGPSVEYSVFPYSESTRKAITLQYEARARHVEYYERTIYDKHSEVLFDESLELGLRLTQPWGSAYASVQGAHYFHDVRNNRADVFGSISLNVAKGLSVNVYGAVSLIRDQIHLSQMGASREEVLLRRRELEKNYEYFYAIGFSYTFGSIYNNIVNPRFGGGGTIILF